MDVYFNIGRGKYDGKFHFYDLTNKIRDTARRINGVERPRGFLSENGISDISIFKKNEIVNTSSEKSSSRNQQSYEEIKKQSAEGLKNLRAEKNAQIDEALLFTDGMKSTHPLCAADFIYAEDFIGEADFAHPTGWISLKRNTFCLVDKRCSFLVTRIPTQFEKKYKDKGTKSKLYMTVAMTKIEAGVLGSTVGKSQAHYLIPTSIYILSDVFSKINTQDKRFLKYIPDGFLSEDQKMAKNEAIKEEKDKIAKIPNYLWKNYANEEDYGMRYKYLKDLKADKHNAEYYVPTIEKLLRKGFLRGKGGSGDETIIDLGEDAVRILVTLDRAGVYGK